MSSTAAAAVSPLANSDQVRDKNCFGALADLPNFLMR